MLLLFVVACVLLGVAEVAAQAGIERPGKSNAGREGAVVCQPAGESRKASTQSSKLNRIDQVLSAARSRTDALIRRDGEALKLLLSDDFVYTNASGRVLDRGAYIQNYALDASVSWSAQTLSDVCVRFSAETAILTAVTHDVARFGEYSLNTRFRTTQVYRRVGKAWVYHAGHTSNIE